MGKSNSYYMQLHVEALFTMNEKNELMTIREPWDSTSQPAPRFYLTRPLYEKPHTYFRVSSNFENVLKKVKHQHRYYDVSVLPESQENRHFSMDDPLEEYIVFLAYFL